MNTEQLIPFGILLIFIGTLAIILGAVSQQKAETKFAFGGFVGFIPFGFANDKRMLYGIIGLIALIIIFFIALRIIGKR